MNGFASRWIKLSINSLDRYASALGISVPAFPALSSAPWSPRTAESAPSQLKLSRRVSVSYLGCRENCGPFHICSIPPCWMKWDLPRHFVCTWKDLRSAAESRSIWKSPRTSGGCQATWKRPSFELCRSASQTFTVTREVRLRKSRRTSPPGSGGPGQRHASREAKSDGIGFQARSWNPGNGREGSAATGNLSITSGAQGTVIVVKLPVASNSSVGA